MQPVQLYTILFDIPLQLTDVKEFKSAVSGWRKEYANEAMKEAYIPTDMFHNHDEISGKEINRYPVIQYQSIEGKAAITGINAGAMAVLFLKMLMEDQSAALNIKGKRYEVNFIEKSKPPYVPYIQTVQLTDHPQTYRLNQWMPLDTLRLAKWENSPDLKNKIVVLEEALKEQLDRFLKAVGFPKTDLVQTGISGMQNDDDKKEYKVNKKVFDIEFHCNLTLPSQVGIGQVPSIGFGRILPLVKGE